MIPLRRTCKQVAALVVAREDRPLSLPDRLALRLHMAICAACPKFERQLLVMRNALRQWRHYEEPADPGAPGAPASPDKAATSALTGPN
jgi:Putative zinc-finger